MIKWEPFDLSTRWHYHPELEIIYFIKGKTNGVIGDGFMEFEAGDLLLLGSNFPHVLQENNEFNSQYPEDKPFGLIIQFNENFLGDIFFNIPEMKSIQQLFERAKRGIQFKGYLREKICTLLSDIQTKKESQKLLLLLEALDLMASDSDSQYEFLTNQDYYFNYSEDEERMWKVNEYVYKHFKEKISISEIASIAHMTETSFCRYFKARTLKSFTQFLNEIRIAYSCKLLKKKNVRILAVSQEAGFNNFSYFCRTFKKVVKITPYEYVKGYQL